MQGSVLWFNSKKGYGFIKPEGGGADLFVHFTQIDAEGYRQLEEGDLVEFEVGENRGKKQAEQVRKLAS